MQQSESTMEQSGDGSYLDGQLLVAMPSMPDKRFMRSVIYLCAHTADGAMGIIINQKAPKLGFSDLLIQLEVIGAKEAIHLPPEISETPVLRGGPVETGRGFVLHSDEFTIADSTMPIHSGVALTATLEILRAMAHGQGPHRALLALGYASWAPGQLENEIQQNGWLTAPADPTLVFDAAYGDKYDRALRLIGVEPGYLSGESGHA